MCLERNQTGTRDEGRGEREGKGRKRDGEREKEEKGRSKGSSWCHRLSHWCCLCMSWVTKCTWSSQVNKNLAILPHQGSPQHVLCYVSYTTSTLCKMKCNILYFWLSSRKKEGTGCRCFCNQSLWGQKRMGVGMGQEKKKKKNNKRSSIHYQIRKAVFKSWWLPQCLLWKDATHGTFLQL